MISEKSYNEVQMPFGPSGLIHGPSHVKLTADGLRRTVHALGTRRQIQRQTNAKYGDCRTVTRDHAMDLIMCQGDFARCVHMSF